VDSTFEVFISYGHDDAAWVRTLAENLERRGIRTFFDEWEIRAGDVLVHKLEEGLRSSRTGIVVVSPASVARPWVQEEYAAMVTAAVAGRQRLIPVLLGEAELPPFAASRLWVDFRQVDGTEYQRRFDELVAALKDELPVRPEPDGRLVLPEGTGTRPEGARRAILRIATEQTVLAVDGEREVAGRPAGPSHDLETRRWQAERARRLALANGEAMLRSTEREAGANVSGVRERLVEFGMGLAAACLPEPVQAALAGAVARAERENSALRLGIEVAEAGWADLSWETLTLPDSMRPLVLEPRVELYRAVPGLGTTPAMAIQGPLRILVVIGSPDQGERGELLDYEAELRRILDAVDPARRAERAYVRILNRGTLSEVRAALAAQRFHVLHISCHAKPGALVLEDDDGGAELVSAAELAEQALPADRGVPLVVLGGCATALSHRSQSKDDGGEGEAALPGLARELLANGVPAVLAMNASVTDPYATLLGAELYRELAGHVRPDPLGAVSHARRRVDAELRAAPDGSREAHLASLAEWTIPTLFVRGVSLPLFDASEGFDKVEAPPEPALPGVVVRAVGDFIGRRREERLLGRALHGQHAGVVVHGIGGVGKSTLAAQLIANLAEQAGVVVSLGGKLTVDQLFDELSRRLLAVAVGRGWDETHPLRRAIPLLRDPQLLWQDRVGLLAEHALRREPIVLVLDNFEDNLTAERDHGAGHVVADPELAEFLAAWVRSPGLSRVLITSRYPFALPDQAHRQLETLHLGPLSWAETRKLIWRLPGLDALAPNQQQRAWTDVGGHPRSLEYLDALLRGGAARFGDIAQRLEATLTRRGITNPKRWLDDTSGDLDRALAETVTLAVDEVLLSRLLERLEDVPLARELLLGVSVYRRPVDIVGMVSQLTGQLPEQTEQGELRLLAPEGFQLALTVLRELGLVSPVEAATSTGHEGQLETFLVHRWTARALADLAIPAELTSAHRRAARYWRWRTQVWRQYRTTAVNHLLEARHHHLAANELDDAVDITAWLCTHLHTWGAWSWEERLCRETLAVVPEQSRHAATFTQQLGLIAQQRGDYDHALDWYRHALAIFEDLGDRAGIASSYHQLGRIAQLRGDYDQALDWYHRSLAIEEKLGKRAGMAASYHQLGMIAEERGDYDQALDWYHRSLAIEEELGNREGIATSYQQLGVLARKSGDYDQAVDWSRQALTIQENLGDRLGMATSFQELGVLAELRSDYDQALDWYRRSLAIHEELGNRRGTAGSYHNLGNVAFRRGDPDDAQRWYRHALAIFEDLGNRAGIAASYHQLGILAHDGGHYDQALDCYRHALAIFEDLGDRAGIAASYHQLGMVAQLRGEYDQALDWYGKALTVKEKLGDRAGAAADYNQLGRLAHERGDYDQALDRYQRALAIFEDLGDRAGMAATICQLGILSTENGAPAQGAQWNLRSLGIRSQIRSPEARIDLHWLLRQRELLGAPSFQQLVQEQLDEEEAVAVLELLDRWTASGGTAGPTGPDPTPE
jgi:tetratricopeptide (TPR) repeat protein